MAAKSDNRKLERTSSPGIYRRHNVGCPGKRCKCPYVVIWRGANQKQHRQMFPTWELAREHKGTIDSGKTTREPQSRTTVGAYYEEWIDTYAGRTSRGLESTTRNEYRMSFENHVLPLPIARARMRDLTARHVRDWLKGLEKRGATPSAIRKAKAALSVMLASAREENDIGANPAQGVRYVPSEAAKRAHPKRRRKKLTAEDVQAILAALPEQWQACFALLAQSGLRIGELLGLTWEHVHLGDAPYIMVAEQIYEGRRKKLKTDASAAPVRLSESMALWLGKLRPVDAKPAAPVFPSTTGGALSYHNLYSRVLRPALEKSGIAIVVGEKQVRRGRQTVTEPVYDYQGVAFHAFRKACGSLLHDHGMTDVQVQRALRHGHPDTTRTYYMQPVDDGSPVAEAWDDIPVLPPGWDNNGTTRHPETAAKDDLTRLAKMAQMQDILEQDESSADSLAPS